MKVSQKEFDKINSTRKKETRGRPVDPETSKTRLPQQKVSACWLDYGLLKGNRISKLLHDKELRQADLAYAVGVKREYINRLINGKIVPKIFLALIIARALNVTVEDIWGECLM